MSKKEQRQQAILRLIQTADDDQMVRTADLASRLAVSEMTVRRDLLDLAAEGRIQRQHGGVAIPLREKPLPALYRVGILLVSRGMKFLDPFFNEVIEGLDRELLNRRCEIAYIRTMLDVGTVEQARDLLRALPADGIITVGMQRAEAIAYLKEHAPVLVTIVDPLGPDHDTIMFDGANGTRAIVTHLSQLGYRRLGFITGYPDVREQGFIEGVAQHGLDDDPELRVTIDYDIDGWSPEVGQMGAAALLNLEEPPDAIVCASDRLAIGAIQWLHQRGLRVPDDIAVTGFDNIRDSAFTIPPLTTVHVHKGLIGKLAAERLVRRMEDPDEVPLQICTPIALVVRESCGSQLRHTP